MDDFVEEYDTPARRIAPTPTRAAGMPSPGLAIDDYFSNVRKRRYEPPDFGGYGQSRLTAPAFAPSSQGRAPVRGDSPFTPAGPPQRYQVNLLGDLLESAPGQFVMGTPGAQRGGVVSANIGFGGFGVATAPVNFQNFATYAREAPLSLITSALGHRYQQNPDDPYARPVGPRDRDPLLANIGQADLPGILDNVIDGLQTAGDAAWAPFQAFGDWVRNWEAFNRGKAVRDILATGSTPGQLINRVVSVFDDSKFRWDGVVEKAREKGVSELDMLAELWDLDPEIVRAIASKPGGLEDDALHKLTDGQPFSYDPAANVVAELAVLGAPLLAGGAVARGVGAAAKASGLLRGRTLTELGLLGRPAATAERVGSWALRMTRNPAVRTAGALTGFTPTGLKVGAGIRFGEWAIKQVAEIAGADDVVRMMDNWLWEMPLSNNPGLMMVDAFAVHPMAAAKAAKNRVVAGAVKVFGQERPAELPAAAVRRLDSVADMDLGTLQERLLDRLGWERPWVESTFGDGGPLTLRDLKNGLYYVALQVVRRRHEARARYLAPEAGIVERSDAFVREYGAEAAELLADELAGRGTAIVDEFKTEFWERGNLVEGSALGREGAIGPYDGWIAFDRFAGWVRASRSFADVAETAVASLRTDVDTAFLAAFREQLVKQYPNANATVSARTLNQLQAHIPSLIGDESAILRGRRGVPRVTRRQLEALLDRAETSQQAADLRAARPRTAAVPAIRPHQATSAKSIALAFRLRQDTVAALQRAGETGLEGLGPVPGDLAKALTELFGMQEAQLRRDPVTGWKRGVEWFTAQYEAALVRGEALDALDRLAKAIEGRYPRTDVAADKEAFRQIGEALTHPYSDAELKANPALEAIATARDEALTTFVDEMSRWLDSPLRRLRVKQAAGGIAVLETDNFRATDAALIANVAERARGVRGLSPEMQALLADPLAHPLEKVDAIKRAFGAGFRTNAVQRQRIADLPSFEGEFSPLFAEVYGDGAPPVSRDTVRKLTEEVAGHADQLDRLRDQARALGGIIDRSPSRGLTKEVREFLDRARILGVRRIGAARDIEVANWRSLELEPAAITEAANEAAKAAGLAKLDRDLATFEDTLARIDTSLERARARAGDTLTRGDIEWNEAPVDGFGTLKAARDLAKDLRDAGHPALITKVGPRRWEVRTGTLLERAPEPPREPVRAVAGEVVEEAPGPTDRDIEIARAMDRADQQRRDEDFLAEVAAGDPRAQLSEDARRVLDVLDFEAQGLPVGELDILASRIESEIGGERFEAARAEAEAFRAAQPAVDAPGAVETPEVAPEPAPPVAEAPRVDPPWTSGVPGSINHRLTSTAPDAATAKARLVVRRDATRWLLTRAGKGGEPAGPPPDWLPADVVDQLVALEESRLRAISDEGAASMKVKHDDAKARKLPEWQDAQRRKIEAEAAIADALEPHVIARAAGAEPAPPATPEPPPIVERIAEQDRVTEAAREAFVAEQDARQAAFRAHADAYPERRRVPVAPVADPLDEVKTALRGIDRADQVAYDALVERYGLEAVSAADNQLERGAADVVPAPFEVTFLDPADNATPIRSRVVLVDAGDVLTSDQLGFPANLQPRARDIRASSAADIAEMAKDLQPDKLFGVVEGAEGMPVVTPEGAVLAGNGRIMAIRAAKRPSYAKYKVRLQAEASKYGFDPAVLDQMERPILVRELVDVAPEAQNRLAWQLNPTLPPADLAPSVASGIPRSKIAALKVADSESLRDALMATKNADAVRGLVETLPRDWQKRYFEGNKGLNRDGVVLFEGAILSKLLRADDRTLPTFEDARGLVFSMIEDASDDIRRVTSALAEAAGQILRAQDQAEAGLIGGEILQFSDDLVPALRKIQTLRQRGLTFVALRREIETIDAFDEFVLTGQQQAIARAIAHSDSAKEMTTFLRGVAEAGEINPASGMELFSDQRADYASLVNEGIRKWNDARLAAGKSAIDFAPSTEPPYDVPVTLGPRESLLGETLPPVTKSQPLAPDEVATEIAARTAGEPVHAVAEFVADVDPNATTLSFSEPQEARYAQALIDNPDAVMAEIEELTATWRAMSDQRARVDFYSGLRDDANFGILSGGAWRLLRELTGYVRRAKTGRLNMTYTGRELPADFMQRVAAEAQLVKGRTIVDAAPDGGAVVIRPRPARDVTPEQLAEDTGPAVPPVDPDPMPEGVAATSRHTIVTNENARVTRRIRTALGAPDVPDPQRRIIEFNAPTGRAMVERFEALRQQALSKVESTRADRAAAAAAPAPTETVSSIFHTPELAGMWDRLMRSDVDPAAAAIGSAEPSSLAAIMDAVESIDRGIYKNPKTGVGLEPNEAMELRSRLLEIANRTLEAGIERKGLARASAAAERFRRSQPDDFDIEELQDRTKLIIDDLAEIVRTSDDLPPLAGFLGTQYAPTPPPTRSKAGPVEPISPRLLFRDFFADDVVPGLFDELETGRMEDIGRRIGNHRFVRLMEHALGSRPENEIRARAISNFKRELRQYADPDLTDLELAKIDRVADRAFSLWREEMESHKTFGFTRSRKVHQMGPEVLNKRFAQAVDEVYGTGTAPSWVLQMQLSKRDAAALWRRADNRLRNYLAESEFSLARGLERYYGRQADRLSGAGAGITVLYYTIRFLGDIRWMALEAVEPLTITLPRAGVKPVLESSFLRNVKPVREGARRLGLFDETAPMGFGQPVQIEAFKNYAHWAQLSDTAQSPSARHRYLLRALAKEQKRPFRKAVEEMLERDPAFGRMLRELGETPDAFIRRLDRDWSMAEQGTRQFETHGQAEAFFRPWRDAGIIDEETFRSFVAARRYNAHPAIEAELKRVVGDPVATALYERLAQINHGLFHDLTSVFFGQPNRSNLQRLANHPFLYWPVSYQIKATKWLLRFMLDESFGVDTGSLGAFAIQHVAEEHKRRLQTDERYRANLEANETLYFLSSMLLPITPWDIGVSLSPWTRMLVDPEYQRAFGIFGVGPFYTYGSLVPRLIREQSRPGGVLDNELGKRLAQALPLSVSVRQPGERPTSTIDAENTEAIPFDARPIPTTRPEVPRLP